MVTTTRSFDPLGEAALIGRDLHRTAIRDGGRVMWIGEDRRHEGWRPVARALDADLASGLAGIGWFLAQLAAATNEPSTSELARDSLATALDRAPDLLAEHRLGWFGGALGVAWAARTAGSMLRDDELIDRSVRLTNDTVDALATLRTPEVGGSALVGGTADVLLGVVCIGIHHRDDRVEAAGHALAGHLASALVHDPAGRIGADGNHSAVMPSAPGIAAGTTGVVLALEAWARATGDRAQLDLASSSVRAERHWFEPGAGWYCRPASPDPTPLTLDWSWSAGAAGVGAARLARFSHTSDVRDLADVAAAIEVVHLAMRSDDGNEPSYGHGTSGGIDLFTTAGTLLGEPLHHAAARLAAGALALRLATDRGADGIVTPGGPDPTLLHGMAGVGVAMLRVADEGRTETPFLPDFLVARSDPFGPASGASQEPGARSSRSGGT